MGHTKDMCWRKNGKGPFSSANFLEVMVNGEEATLTKLNRLCGVKHNFFLTSKCQREECMYKCLHLEEEEKNHLTMKVWMQETWYLMETILMIPGELEYLEGIVKLARRRKDA
jgi:hypothetical protein